MPLAWAGGVSPGLRATKVEGDRVSRHCVISKLLLLLLLLLLEKERERERERFLFTPES